MREASEANSPRIYSFSVSEPTAAVLLAFYFVSIWAGEKGHFILTVAILAFWLNADRNLLRPALRLMAPMLLFVLIGSAHSLALLQFNFDTLKGAWYSVRLPIYIVFGIAMAGRLQSDRTVFSAIVLGSTMLAFWYIGTLYLDPNLAASSRTVIRNTLGTGSVLNGMTVALAVLAITKYRAPAGVVLAYLFAAVAAYLIIVTADSRTLLIAVPVILLFGTGILSIRRFLIPMVISVLLVEFLLTTPALLALVPQEHLSTFALNAPNAINEVLSIDRGSVGEVNNSWRGYETFLAFTETYAAGLSAVLFGTGMHTSVSLPLVMDLGGEMSDTVPIFHNGFSFLLFRGGVVGLFLFAWQNMNLCRALREAEARSKAHGHIIRFAAGVLLLATVSTATIAGLINPGENGATPCVIIGYAISKALRGSADPSNMVPKWTP